MGADDRLFCAIRLRKRTNLSVLVTSEPDELSIQGSLPGARVQRGAGRQRRPQKAAGILKHRPSRQARPAHILLGIICIIWRKMAADPAASLLCSPTPSC